MKAIAGKKHYLYGLCIHILTTQHGEAIKII